MSKFRAGRIAVSVATVLALNAVAGSAQALTIEEAIRLTVETNPSIGEARANRRAVDYELRQAWGRFLPQVSVQASAGPTRADRPNSINALDNDKWRFGRDVGMVVRQNIFTGFESSNEVYRQSARVDGAALRVLERSEVVALDAAEAYIDILRHQRILGIARENISRHQSILGTVSGRVEGGRASSSESQQANERLAAAQAVVGDVTKSLEDAKARFRAIVGVEPSRLAAPRRFPGLPGSKGAAIAAAQSAHPSLQVASADTDAAHYDFEKAKAGYLPQVYAEGSATVGRDVGGVEGRDRTYGGRLVMSWSIFDGGITSARRGELAERYSESQSRTERIRREVILAVEQAWNSISTADMRIGALQRQVNAGNGVIRGYSEEYELSRRGLLDLLDAENSRFNAQIQLASAQYIRLFATYQLAASSGVLLKNLNIQAPLESASNAREHRGFLAGGSVYVEPLRKN